jgi:hypothetical protein
VKSKRIVLKCAIYSISLVALVFVLLMRFGVFERRAAMGTTLHILALAVASDSILRERCPVAVADQKLILIDETFGKRWPDLESRGLRTNQDGSVVLAGESIHAQWKTNRHGIFLRLWVGSGFFISEMNAMGSHLSN